MKRILVGAFLGLTSLSLCQLSYFEDFNDGKAQGWASDQGFWGVENFYYHGVGQLVNNRYENVAYVQTFGGENVSAEAIMHTDAGFDDVNKMLVARYQDPGNYLIFNFIAASRNFFVVAQVVNGVGTRLIPEFTYHLPNQGQTEWRHCRIDLDGTRVIAYFEGGEVFNAHIPAIVVRPGVVGAMTFATPTGGNEELFVDNYRAGYFDYTPISSSTVNPGIINSGNLNSVAEPDGNFLILRPGPVLSSSLAPVRATFTGTSQVPMPTEFRLKFQGFVSAGNLRQTIMLMNYQTNQFEVLVDGSAPLFNGRQELVITQNPSRFVSPLNGEVVARVSYIATGPVLSYPWTARIDYVAMTSRT
jgi:hypothetical protein